MVLAYYGLLGSWTIDGLAAQTGLRNSDSGLQCWQIVDLLAHHGFSAKTATQVTLDRIRVEMDSNRPVIGLGGYRFIKKRLDQRDNQPGQDGHFIVIVGYEDNNFFINDPDYWYPYYERGHDYVVPASELESFLTFGGQIESNCVFCVGVAVNNPPPVVNLVPPILQTWVDQLAQANAITLNVIAGIKAYGVAAPAPPPPSPPPPDPVPPKEPIVTVTNPTSPMQVYLVNTASLNARYTPGLAGTIFLGIERGYELTIEDTNKVIDNHHWGKITDAQNPGLVGKFVALELLVKKA